MHTQGEYRSPNALKQIFKADMRPEDFLGKTRSEMQVVPDGSG